MCASIEWTVKPTDEKKGVFELKFWNLTRPSFVNPPGTVTARLWMPDMGHGSSPITVAQKKDSNGQTMVGQFVASDVYFVMGGHWEIWLELKENKKIIDSAKMDIDI